MRLEVLEVNVGVLVSDPDVSPTDYVYRQDASSREEDKVVMCTWKGEKRKQSVHTHYLC